MGVLVREKVKGSGIWWIFINHKGRRMAQKIGKSKKSANALAEAMRHDLNLASWRGKLINNLWATKAGPKFESLINDTPRVIQAPASERGGESDFVSPINEVNQILNALFCHNPKKRKIGSHLRMAILKRDKENCVVCGRNGGNAVLEVDHIVPLSFGGETVAENLRTLCRSCNSGKSNIFTG
jgi:hypothetical protein